MSIGDWMETPQGGRITGYAFGFGAAVVIVGALFKIMHWPGASVVLVAGMGTEAILFVITAFGNPHPTYHWDHVFPQLTTSEEDQQPLSISGSIGGGVSSSVGGGAVGSSSVASAMGDVSSLSEEDVKKMTQGIAKISETAEQLAKLSEVGVTAEKFISNMNVASGSLDVYNTAQKEINDSVLNLVASYRSISNNINIADQNSLAYISAIDGVNKNLSLVNTAYEMQLKNVESANVDFASYKANVAKMNEQVSSLNDIYGNMLNALA